MSLQTLVAYLRDEATPWWKRWLLVGALAYTALPFDAIPDVVPVLGWLDDVGVLAATAAFITRDVGRYAKAKLSVRR